MGEKMSSKGTKKLVNFITCPCCGEVVRLTLESQKEHNKKINQVKYGKNIDENRKLRSPCPECGSISRHKKGCPNK